jgi:hypothetical protein
MSAVEATRLEQHECDIGDGQSGTQTCGITSAGINDDVAVLRSHLEHLCPHGGAGQGNGGIPGCTELFSTLLLLGLSLHEQVTREGRIHLNPRELR